MRHLAGLGHAVWPSLGALQDAPKEALQYVGRLRASGARPSGALQDAPKEALQ
jgi:hypothetical protein